MEGRTNFGWDIIPQEKRQTCGRPWSIYWENGQTLFCIPIVSYLVFNQNQINNMVYMMQYTNENTYVFSVTPHTAEMYKHCFGLLMLHHSQKYILLFLFMCLLHIFDVEWVLYIKLLHDTLGFIVVSLGWIYLCFKYEFSPHTITTNVYHSLITWI